MEGLTALNVGVLIDGGMLATLLGIFYRLGHLGERIRSIDLRVAKLEQAL
jgi:hypothetical protein